uniref:ABC transporter substrate-binding protein n=1 Tax=Streptomyces sp. NPDC059568 TaxID=3346868 RepID=UPI0036C5ABC1
MRTVPFRSSPTSLGVLSIATVAVLGLSACGSSGGNTSSAGKTFVDGKTFTLALTSDPGALDPQMGATGTLFQVNRLAYDSLVSVDDKGTIKSQLAKSWKFDGTKVTFEINSGVTCADGSAFTAQTAADNIAFVEDPKNHSPLLGVSVPAGAKAEVSGSTLTVTLATPAPFALSSFARLPMVCESGLKDRTSLKAGTAGTGPYTLKAAVSGDHYTYQLRTGYTWGPGGAATSATGMPATIEVKIVSNETTIANQILSGAVNAASIEGPDAARLNAAKVSRVDEQVVLGEQWYNHATGHTSDPAVRAALTRSLDLGQLQKVLTSGKGGPATQLAAVAPAGCTGNSVQGNVPSTDVAAATAGLEAAGWAKGADGIYAKDGKKLTVSLLYDTTFGTGGGAAADLAVQQWKAAGIQATAKGLDQTGMQTAMFSTGDWDVVWEPVNVNTPDQLVPFLSGRGVADGGTNFAGIQNADYSADVTKAMAQVGTAGCSDWLAAEGKLFAANDVVPFANSILSYFAKGAQMTVVSTIVPTSIRMLG